MAMMEKNGQDKYWKIFCEKTGILKLELELLNFGSNNCDNCYFFYAFTLRENVFTDQFWVKINSSIR